MTKRDRQTQIKALATQLHRVHLIYHHASREAKYRWSPMFIEINTLRGMVARGDLNPSVIDVLYGIQWVYGSGRLDGARHMKLRAMNTYQFLKLVAEIAVDLDRPTNAEVRDWLYANFRAE